MNHQLIRKHGKTGGQHKIGKILVLNQIDGFFKVCKIKTVRDAGTGTECYPPPEIYDSDSESEMLASEISVCNISSDRCTKCNHLKNNCICVREIQINITGIRLNKSTQCDL